MFQSLDHNEKQIEHDASSHLIASLPLRNALDTGLSRALKVEAEISPESRIILRSEPHGMAADKFRMLRVYLRCLANSQGLKVVMITSALNGEGKSFCSANLAVALAERRDTRVVLVEGDLRCPGMAATLGVESWPGLVQCLRDGSDPVDSLRYVNGLGIYFLPAGEVCTNPIQYLNSERFAKIIQRLRFVADWVILDCPPVIPVPDTLAIRGTTDGCLWVLRSNQTTRSLVDRAIQKLGQEVVVGVVLNEAECLESQYQSYYRYNPLHMLGSGTEEEADGL